MEQLLDDAIFIFSLCSASLETFAWEYLLSDFIWICSVWVEWRRVVSQWQHLFCQRFAYIQISRLQTLNMCWMWYWAKSIKDWFCFSTGTFWSRQAAVLVDLKMFRKKKKKRPEISAPKNFEHRVHTSFDVQRGCFVGLPTQWQSLIENLRRPKPMVDPSRITEVELRPKKVRHIGKVHL